MKLLRKCVGKQCQSNRSKRTQRVSNMYSVAPPPRRQRSRSRSRSGSSQSFQDLLRKNTASLDRAFSQEANKLGPMDGSLQKLEYDELKESHKKRMDSIERKKRDADMMVQEILRATNAREPSFQQSPVRLIPKPPSQPRKRTKSPRRARSPQKTKTKTRTQRKTAIQNANLSQPQKKKLLIKKKKILGFEREMKSLLNQLKILKKQKEALKRATTSKTIITKNDQTIVAAEKRIDYLKEQIKKARLEPLKGGKCRTKRKRTKRR